MKKVILSMALLAGVVFSSQAQTEQGKIIVGGSVSFQTSKIDLPGANSSDRFEIIPSVGYFLADNIAVGTGIGFGSTKNPSGSKSEEFIVSPFGRYYLPLADKFHFFGQLSLPMEFGSNKDAAGAKTSSTTSIGVDVSPGFAFFPTSKIGIELTFNGISYENYKNEPVGGSSVSNNSFSIGTDFFAPRLGVQFHF